MGGLVQAFSMLGWESLDGGLIRVWIWGLAYACLLVEYSNRMFIAKMRLMPVMWLASQ